MAERPNIIFIMPDQLRADFLSCYGATFIETPHIDSLAERGARYERAYSASPVCVPARAALMTGLNAIKVGVTDNGQWLRPDYRACGLQTMKWARFWRLCARKICSIRLSSSLPATTAITWATTT